MFIYVTLSVYLAAYLHGLCVFIWMVQLYVFWIFVFNEPTHFVRVQVRVFLTQSEQERFWVSA